MITRLLEYLLANTKAKIEQLDLANQAHENKLEKLRSDVNKLRDDVNNLQSNERG